MVCETTFTFRHAHAFGYEWILLVEFKKNPDFIKQIKVAAWTQKWRLCTEFFFTLNRNRIAEIQTQYQNTYKSVTWIYHDGEVMTDSLQSNGIYIHIFEARPVK